jgi:hypothetical protein
MIRIELPWPPAILGNNGVGRCGWRAKQEAKEVYRKTCYVLALKEKQPLPEGNIFMKITFFPPNNRHHDWDNCVTKMKYGIDGIANALQFNDKRLRPVLVDYGEVVPNGKVVVEI